MNTPATPETFKNPCNAAIPNWTFGHNRAVKNAAGIMIRKPTKITNVDPWKIPSNSGNFLSKYLLWIHTEIDAITIEPMIEVSNVIAPAILVIPVGNLRAGVTSTPKNLNWVKNPLMK